MHDLTLTSQYADRIALLAAGRLVGVSAPREVLTEANSAEHYSWPNVLAGRSGSVVVVPRGADTAVSRGRT
ncbi:MAG: hypothetical protein M3P91_09665 [Actinomycetota bacterium]|nr:hypothetical protein [Actinomycetota bacterium]